MSKFKKTGVIKIISEKKYKRLGQTPWVYPVDEDANKGKSDHRRLRTDRPKWPRSQCWERCQDRKVKYHLRDELRKTERAGRERLALISETGQPWSSWRQQGDLQVDGVAQTTYWRAIQNQRWNASKTRVCDRFRFSLRETRSINTESSCRTQGQPCARREHKGGHLWKTISGNRKVKARRQSAQQTWRTTARENMDKSMLERRKSLATKIANVIKRVARRPVSISDGGLPLAKWTVNSRNASNWSKNLSNNKMN